MKYFDNLVELFYNIYFWSRLVYRSSIHGLFTGSTSSSSDDTKVRLEEQNVYFFDFELLDSSVVLTHRLTLSLLGKSTVATDGVGGCDVRNLKLPED